MDQLTAPFGTHPCPCVTEHRPAVAYTHAHHVHPLYRGGDPKGEIAYLCPAGHDQVHRAIRLFERAGRVIPVRMNRYLYGLAVRGFELGSGTA